MSKVSTNQLGRHGETCVERLLSRVVLTDKPAPLFRAISLNQNDGYPDVDLLVDVLDERDRAIALFYLQVRTTSGSEDDPPDKLSVRIKKDEFDALLRLALPAYVAVLRPALPNRCEEAYLLSPSRERTQGVGRIVKRHRLDDDETLFALRDEVLSFWEGVRLGFSDESKTSRFGDE